MKLPNIIVGKYRSKTNKNGINRTKSNNSKVIYRGKNITKVT